MTLIMDKIYSFHKNKNNQYHDFIFFFNINYIKKSSECK